MNGIQTPCSAQYPISGGNMPTRPEHTKAPIIWTETRPRSAPSSSITTLAPSLRSQAPSMVKGIEVAAQSLSLLNARRQPTADRDAPGEALRMTLCLQRTSFAFARLIDWQQRGSLNYHTLYLRRSPRSYSSPSKTRVTVTGSNSWCAGALPRALSRLITIIGNS